MCLFHRFVFHYRRLIYLSGIDVFIAGTKIPWNAYQCEMCMTRKKKASDLKSLSPSSPPVHFPCSLLAHLPVLFLCSSCWMIHADILLCYVLCYEWDTATNDYIFVSVFQQTQPFIVAVQVVCCQWGAYERMNENTSHINLDQKSHCLQKITVFVQWSSEERNSTVLLQLRNN